MSLEECKTGLGLETSLLDSGSVSVDGRLGVTACSKVAAAFKKWSAAWGRGGGKGGELKRVIAFKAQG